METFQVTAFTVLSHPLRSSLIAWYSEHFVIVAALGPLGR